MLYRDTHGSRQLASERHAELKQDWRAPSGDGAPALETRSYTRTRLAWLRAHLRSAGSTTARHAS
jgi:hypothetical protein